MTADRLYTIEKGNSAQTVDKMLRVLFPDAWTVLDSTYGKGRFWAPCAPWWILGLDISPHGRPHVVGDFTRLPFADGAFDVVVFDPPYLSDTSRKTASIMDKRFGSYRSEAEAIATVQDGASEAWRVARLGVLVKIQDHIHASLFVDMQGWVREALRQPLYGKVEQVRPVKLTDPKWTDQLSAWSNSATFLAFRKGSQRHVRRQPRRFEVDG